jgi:hypothetical protein
VRVKKEEAELVPPWAKKRLQGLLSVGYQHHVSGPVEVRAGASVSCGTNKEEYTVQMSRQALGSKEAVLRLVGPRSRGSLRCAVEVSAQVPVREAAWLMGASVVRVSTDGGLRLEA